ncbi:cysteine synthase A [Halioglobus japonicus]|uniref:cysteine synthase n=1 Tax=Halioglobus japonicus TaxID=930805 RepID=A0AAP8MCR2_9GAMM|nr:cysteine synthase A [Halioglobus japonicus]AQA17272.1 cysteine synthase A [Halioglobus japonicus]PLW85189.1 cysteine synthase A [Halioglobus japonicus]GHD19921.1 cysteine synthase A [Halioglobus japonicus]
MLTAPDVTQLIGNTPLLHLRQVSEQTGCTILGKAEFLNPGGSVKDRTALGIIRAAEKAGDLQPGGRIVEGTAGNTGIGLTLVANALGYKSTVVMPITQSKEKIDSLELLGADLHLVPAASYDDDKHYVHTAARLADKLAGKEEHGAIWARQFDNPANMAIHEATTGQEIWAQTEGRVDGFVCSVGTGGTLAGVSSALKSHNPGVAIGIVDPCGASLYNHFAKGRLEKSEGNSIIEGIGINHITDNLAAAQVDHAYHIRDEDALPYAYNLLQHEGLCLGGSSAINIAGAVKLAEELGPGHTIVTILCDYGTRYQSKLFNPVYLENKGLPVPEWLQI